jgi:peptidoglycan hydrolase-like protein with peptidoglycan-binding domain
MKKIILVVLSILCALSITASATNIGFFPITRTAQNANTKRKPIFRATRDQVKQAQAILKQRGFYSGEQTGKLDGDTRNGLKKFQEAEKLKVTGTLNKTTLEKMGVGLTDTQRTM